MYKQGGKLTGLKATGNGGIKGICRKKKIGDQKVSTGRNATNEKGRKITILLNEKKTRV